MYGLEQGGRRVVWKLGGGVLGQGEGGMGADQGQEGAELIDHASAQFRPPDYMGFLRLTPAI